MFKDERDFNRGRPILMITPIDSDTVFSLASERAMYPFSFPQRDPWLETMASTWLFNYSPTESMDENIITILSLRAIHYVRAIN